MQVPFLITTQASNDTRGSNMHIPRLFFSHLTLHYTPRAGPHRHATSRQDAISAVRLLVDTDIVRQSAEQICLVFDPAQDLLVGDKELDPARGPEVADCGAAEVAEQADAGDEDAGCEDEEEGGGPGGDLVRADAGRVSSARVGVCVRGKERKRGREEEK